MSELRVRLCECESELRVRLCVTESLTGETESRDREVKSIERQVRERIEF